MRRTVIASFIIILTIAMAYSSLLANIQIMLYEVNGKKVHIVKRDGQTVNQCTYCHTGTGIEQAKGKKQNFLKGQANYKKLASMPKCSGSGCHVK